MKKIKKYNTTTGIRLAEAEKTQIKFLLDNYPKEYKNISDVIRKAIFKIYEEKIIK